jgi:predicted TIM-barrel fold metal-dependent hydrolase
MSGNVPHISVEGDLAFMERTGITFAVTSITAEESTYHQPIEDEIKYLQDCNEYQMDMVSKNPTKFGAFLNFPLSCPEHAIAGIQDVREKYGNRLLLR